MINGNPAKHRAIGAIMAAVIAVSMVQGVCDPTPILSGPPTTLIPTCRTTQKRTMQYLWALTLMGLVLDFQ